ncbi:MAG: acyl carrier protein [Phreatobacter sp.]|uniref:acyl carrier protein n=1 Tax=Phreatobacter sp. TaxID=1966341 RepID=UPI001A4D47FA|nr:acyl carrier protein [Phreatobacter sp.]MBL8569677.1 acyl carrier protein [Phreatobacter sp.]MCA0319006.1 acyl carrier protein [Pseudomonadota bacterium]
MKDQISEIIARTVELPGGIDSLTDTSDLYEAGMTSFGSVQLMLALEEAFDVEFPERMLNRRLFSSIATIRAALDELTSEKAGA